jgi:hypothetical protein
MKVRMNMGMGLELIIWQNHLNGGKLIIQKRIKNG